jgi:hypothetical protein
LLVSLAVAYLTIIVGNLIAVQDVAMLPGGLFQTSGYDQTAHSFYAIHTVAVLIAAGSTASLIVLGPLRRAGPLWLCLVLLTILAPLSWLNYARPDFVLPDAAQAGLDLGILILGIVCAYCIVRSFDRVANVQPIQAIVLALVVFGAILLPGFFIILWLCWASGLVTDSYFFAVLWKWILEFATVVSIAVAGFYYLSRTRSSEVNRSDPTISQF